MRRTADRLSDGREIIYFDERDGPPRAYPDPRGLAPVAPSSEIRYDPLLDEWVAIAGHRQTRTFLPPADQCPLCPSTAGPDDARSPRPTTTSSSSRTASRRSPRRPSRDEPPTAAASALVPRLPGLGRCEVVCFTSDHDAVVRQLPPERVRLVVDAWADRTAELSRLPDVEQVFCFENRGEEIGVTLHHPHGQIYGYPFVTPRSRRELESARRYRERTRRDLVRRRPRRRTRGRDARGGRGCALDGVRPRRGALAGRGAPVPAPPGARPPGPRRRRARRLRRASTSTCCAASTPCTTSRCRTWRAGTRPRCAPTVTSPACTCRSSRRGGRRPSSSTSPGSEAGMGVFVSDVLPEDVAARLRAAGPP